MALLNTKGRVKTQRQSKDTTIVTCEIIWLQKLFSNLGHLVDVLVVIYCDNIGNILLVNNSIDHARTKHIEVHYHFVRKKIIIGKINLIHVNIKDQVVDIFTKL